MGFICAMFKHNNQSCSILARDSRLPAENPFVIINNVLAAWRYFDAFWREGGSEADFGLTSRTLDRKLKGQPQLKLYRGDEQYLVFQIVPHYFA